MTKKQQQTKPPADDFRTTYLSSRGAQTLGQHALELPVGHPVRETVKLLLERWAEGETVAFLDDVLVEAEALSNDDLDALMQEAA